MGNVRIRWVIVAGAACLLVAAGFGTLARAAPSDGSLGKKGSDAITLLDPFTLTAVVAASDRPTNQAVQLSTRGSKEGNGNGIGNRGRPPIIVPRRAGVRSPCVPLFGSLPIRP